MRTSGCTVGHGQGGAGAACGLLCCSQLLRWPCRHGTQSTAQPEGCTGVHSTDSLKAMLGVQHSTAQLRACSCELPCGSPAPVPKASGFPGRMSTPTALGVTSSCCLFFPLCVCSRICIHTWFIPVLIFLFLCNATFVCCSWKYSRKFCLSLSAFLHLCLKKCKKSWV